MSAPSPSLNLIAIPVAAAVGVGLLGFASAPDPSVGVDFSSAAAVGGSAAPAPVRAGVRTVDKSDPASWSRKRLAAKLVLAGVTSKNLRSSRPWVASGIAGVVLFGTPPTNLKQQLTSLGRLAPDGRLLVSSDEEGGAVQRLSSLIGRMPSAKTIGRTKTPKQTMKIAKKYGKRMKAVGVNNDLAPVADLAYAGAYMDRDGRAFSAKPKRNGRYVSAFSRGLQSAGVLATVKHWPGGGAVADTHKGAGRTPNWGSVQRRDLVPFNAAFASGTGSVMVSHASVPGLTGGIAASQSRAAMTALRRDAGNDVVIMTDSLAMAAVTSAMGQSQARAAVRAIAAGSDLALVQGNTKGTVKALSRAIKSGEISRDAAVASVERIIDVQTRF